MGPAGRDRARVEWFLLGSLAGVGLALGLHWGSVLTSSDAFCDSCHVHPHATRSWKESSHFRNPSGVVTHCTECHLPPRGPVRWREKVRLGAKDLYHTLFRPAEGIDWNERGRTARAVSYTYDAACLRCHKDLFPPQLSKKGEQGHIHYLQQKTKVACIRCHLGVGHGVKAETTAVLAQEPTTQPYRPAEPQGDGERFQDYVEIIPGTGVRFEMVAIPGDTFLMGSPEDEDFREPDEGPVRKVYVDSFWIGRTEVTWAEYEAFYRATGVKASRYSSVEGADVETGPTPPYGSPDQGWGRGDRPAITMTWYAAVKYCEWLSRVTGRRYRLPTEAEWEYACRGGTQGAYFFPGEPSRYSARTLRAKLFGADTAVIGRYAWYAENSGGRTHLPFTKRPNPFGLFNMIGNVREFCLDWYSPDAYRLEPEAEVLVNPKGPPTGTEHVVRGGSFLSDAAELRCAARDHTRHDAWLLTDPQVPKSIWWYSDCVDVGFRVVREWRPKGPIR
ncbi:MAG: SUMF1/EgtB/PvdO family nonheme iron enzyme [candidate division KSB1 bacterium]|nr:SUMF1/EgtB/PvdO family nonheme iron enzyme [candidate division KSB1 bacterium]